MSFLEVCSIDDLTESKPRAFTVDDWDIILVKVGDSIYALEDNCSHQDMPLCHAKVIEDRLRCPAHGAEFKLATGEAVKSPAFAPVKTFRTKVENNKVLVEV